MPRPRSDGPAPRDTSKNQARKHDPVPLYPLRTRGWFDRRLLNPAAVAGEEPVKIAHAGEIAFVRAVS